MSEQEATPLQFVSNVIELKPDTAYLLVFEGDNVSRSELHTVLQRFNTAGLRCFGLALKSDTTLTVIEAPQDDKAIRMLIRAEVDKALKDVVATIRQSGAVR
jgi:hypothetical protein